MGRRVRAKKKRFDVATAARGLYQQAVARQDFTGATAALRLIRDLGAKGTTEEESYDRDRGYTLDEMSLEEQQELRDIIRTVKLLENKIRQRLGRPQVPVPAHLFEKVKAPEPPRNYPQVYPPEPAARLKVEADENAAPASTPVAVDPLADYDASDPENVYGPPQEVE